jgi:hypothetical protein
MNCLHCNKPIEGRRNTKKYCNNTCKQYAYLNRAYNQTASTSFVLGNSTLNKDQANETTIVNSDQPIINNSINQTPTSHEYIKPPIKEEEYQYINADILDRIQQGHISLNIGSNYFTSSTNYGGRITEQNRTAFCYMVPRVRCIIENLLQLSYKRRIYHRTAITISKAIEEMLMSEHVKALPNDFPFYEDLLKLHSLFLELVTDLEMNKEGLKFKLYKEPIVRYILILNLIRDCTKKEPFVKLFPDLYKIKPRMKPNTVAG